VGDAIVEAIRAVGSLYATMGALIETGSSTTVPIVGPIGPVGLTTVSIVEPTGPVGLTTVPIVEPTGPVDEIIIPPTKPSLPFARGKGSDSFAERPST
jgi:hypothetical protein